MLTCPSFIIRVVDVVLKSDETKWNPTLFEAENDHSGSTDKTMAGKTILSTRAKEYVFVFEYVRETLTPSAFSTSLRAVSASVTAAWRAKTFVCPHNAVGHPHRNGLGLLLETMVEKQILVLEVQTEQSNFV